MNANLNSRQVRSSSRLALQRGRKGVPAKNWNDGNVEAKEYLYSTDVLKLAKDHKVEEVTNSTETLYGIELEFNHSDYSLRELSPLLAVGAFKKDSSVDGEFVTFPYTYNEMVAKLTVLGVTVNKLLSANEGLKWHSSVGMHVHVSRKALPEDKWLNLVGHIIAHVEEICKLAGRGPNEYCKFSYGGTTDRYVAVNLCNKNTVEFRMFLSPSGIEGVLRNLEIVKGWVDAVESYPVYSPPEEEEYEQEEYEEEEEEYVPSRRRRVVNENPEVTLEGETLTITVIPNTYMGWYYDSNSVIRGSLMEENSIKYITVISIYGDLLADLRLTETGWVSTYLSSAASTDLAENVNWFLSNL
jgi:hypothetical protein